MTPTETAFFIRISALEYFVTLILVDIMRRDDDPEAAAKAFAENVGNNMAATSLPALGALASDAYSQEIADYAARIAQRVVEFSRQ